MQNINELQDKVYLLLGKHLIRFQTVEMRLKNLLRCNCSVIMEKESSPQIIAPQVQNYTLGGLSTNALNSFFILDTVEESQLIEKADSASRIDMKISCNLSENSHQELNFQLQEFVKDRNFLVHNFQEKFNLSRLDECQQAVDFLLELEKKHQPFLDQFEQYCLAAQKGIDTQISFLKSNIFKTHFIFPLDEIYKEIQLFINNHRKNGGWISFTTVVMHIVNNFPNVNQKIKNKYGFKNINDLILNSGLFLLQSEPTQKGEKILIKLNNNEKKEFIVLDN